MKVAFYKGKSRFFNKLTSWWLSGNYSHCELVFSDGLCASSSFVDNGVRFKRINFNPDHWDILDIDGDEHLAKKWFYLHEDDKYDLLGLVGFLVRPIKGKKRRWVCSEAIMSALGYEEAWRFDPCSMYPILKAKHNG